MILSKQTGKYFIGEWKNEWNLWIKTPSNEEMRGFWNKILRKEMSRKG